MSSIPECRICGSAELEVILSLGRMPLANALLTEEQLREPEPTYPLDLVFCPDCTLVQITETVPPEKLFREYLYFSSFSDTMVRHAEELAERLIASRHLDSNSLVMEIGSNDGYLLQHYQRRGIPVLGIEPALNVARVAEERGIRTLDEFFDQDLAQRLKDGNLRADLLHLHNVLAHVPNLNDFVKGMGTVLKDGGVAVIEVPYVKDLIDRCEFDTIYHEHLCYFSLTALTRLFQRCGLVLTDVERIPIHGGSLRLFVAREPQGQPSVAAQAQLREEAAWGVDRIQFYLDFGSRAERLKASLRSVLERVKQQEGRIAAYGAPAKGTVLLNYCGIGKELLDFAVDRSPYKQGRYIPGIHLPIYPPSRLLEEMPAYTLLLTWNFADEVLEQQSKYRCRGGQFVLPIPEVRIV